MHETDIPTKVLKEIADIFSYFLLNYFNNIIDSSSFPNHLKLANITLVHKKDSRNDKRNYRPVKLLSNLSSFLANILKQHISVHFEHIFSKQQAGFCRGFNAQHCLLIMQETFRKALDKGRDYAALLTDMAKALAAYLMI